MLPFLITEKGRRAALWPCLSYSNVVVQIIERLKHLWYLYEYSIFSAKCSTECFIDVDLKIEMIISESLLTTSKLRVIF